MTNSRTFDTCAARLALEDIEDHENRSPTSGVASITALGRSSFSYRSTTGPSSSSSRNRFHKHPGQAQLRWEHVNLGDEPMDARVWNVNKEGVGVGSASGAHGVVSIAERRREAVVLAAALERARRAPPPPAAEQRLAVQGRQRLGLSDDRAGRTAPRRSSPAISAATSACPST